ncbi:MAG: DUF3717 domain-containing protein [Burkholderiaceae bacterium]|nr:MAG: DUF3717 domain-containing protein [Burkholderiaceae bacterium]
MVIPLHELEAAINYWRTRSPAQGEAHVLSAEAAALSKPYALMIFQHQSSIELQQLEPAAQEALVAYLKRFSNG